MSFILIRNIESRVTSVDLVSLSKVGEKVVGFTSAKIDTSASAFNFSVNNCH
jgi:hypothetical protein